MKRSLALLFVTVLGLSPFFASATPTYQQNLNGLESSLTIYVYPPYMPINWQSPAKAIMSFFGIEIHRTLASDDAIAFENSLGESGKMSSRYRSTMGHAINHIHCTLPDGKIYDRWSSFSGQNHPEVDVNNILREKIGLGVLSYRYPDGRIIEGEENLKRITFYNGTKQINEAGIKELIRPRYLQIEVTPRSCEKLQAMVTFYESFGLRSDLPLKEILQRPENKILYFDSITDPYLSFLARQKDPNSTVGGGCTPYAVGLVKQSGRYDERLEKLWRHPLTVSERLIGGIPDEHGKIRRVSLSAILGTSLGENWIYEGYRNREMSLYDPSKIWNFIGQSRLCLADRNCEPQTKNFVDSHPFSVGALQVFKDRMKNPRYRTVYEDAGNFEPEFLDVSQPVEGVVWKL
ncbi:MAG: hypothetical protein JSU04_05090 [Bdellovibrionales bacterium]|nr:hypothetical protein [Bdellovibrionales bacterium]